MISPSAENEQPTNVTRPEGWDATDELRENGVENLKRILTAAAPVSVPVSIPAGATCPWPEPPDQAAFHGLAGDIVDAIEPHTEADPVGLLVHTLVGYGSVIRADAHYEVEGARHPARFFAVLVGDSSKGRKDTSKRRIHALLGSVDEAWTKERVLHGLSSGEGLIWAVRDAVTEQQPVKEKGLVRGYQDVEVDPGVKDKRLLVVESEFASLLRILGRDGNTLSPIIRQAWDDGNLRTMTKNSPAVATGAHISIIGHITREELLRYLGSTEQGNGFANRFLWLAVRRSKTLPEGGGVVDASGLLVRLRRAVDHGQTCGHLTWDTEAREVWHATYPTLSAGRPGLLGAVTARAEAQVVRLALTFALLDCAAKIQAPHLEAALALWEYCERSAAWIFGEAMGDPVTDQILGALRQTPDGLTRSDIRDNLFRRHQSSERIGRALTRLVDAGMITHQQVETGGRPAERFCMVQTAR